MIMFWQQQILKILELIADKVKVLTVKKLAAAYDSRIFKVISPYLLSDF